MPYYYHVSRGPEESEIITNLNKNKPVFFAIKDTFWNFVEKDIGKNDYGGYREYELFLNPDDFTESLEPRTEGKIFKVSKNNIRKFKKFLKGFLTDDNRKFLKRNLLIEELKRRKINGIDCHYPINIAGYNPELIIFDISPYIKDLKLVETFKTE